MRVTHRILMALSLLLALGHLASQSHIVLAQGSPSPTRYFYDSRPNNGAPPKYPGQSGSPGAYVVEGLGAAQGGSCTNQNYTETKIRDQAVAWLNANINTVIEITPQKYCASLTTYENLIDRLVTYVMAHTSNASTRFGGIMVDEEPGYGFSSAELISLNQWLHDRLITTPGIIWYFTEAQPNGWNLATYDDIIGQSSPTPQVYSQSMANAVNSECSTNSMCRNLVTVGNLSGIGSWNDPVYTLPRVNGNSWCVNYSEWGTCSVGWWNGYRNQ